MPINTELGRDHAEGLGIFFRMAKYG